MTEPPSHSECQQFITDWCAISAPESNVQCYIDALTPLLLGIPREQWTLVIRNYDDDHKEVQYLLDPADPKHTETWTQWCTSILTFLYRAGYGWSKKGAFDIEDLAQTARLAFAQALPTFGYQSHLSSWAYSVVLRSTRNYLRATQAQRRSGDTQSLDALSGSIHPAVPGDHAQEHANAQLLAERIRAVLQSHPDKRLMHIFHLYTVEGKTSVEIGALFQLHESRIRALIQLARKLLQVDPDIRRWLEEQE